MTDNREPAPSLQRLTRVMSALNTASLWLAGMTVAALVTGITIALVGLIVPVLRWLYDYAWFVGFFAAGAVYLALMRRR